MRSTAHSEKTLLAKYRAKRRFDETPEPTGSTRVKKKKALRFVVQKHDATRLHYDFRLEADGVLKSWAVPKGPSLDPADKRLAMQVEDHPLDYYDFEGVIPAGNYGAGEVVVWDWGTYETVEGDDPARAIAAGKIKIRMRGEKLTGVFTLVRMHGRGDTDRGWLLIKERDESADTKWRAEKHAESVKSGRTLDDIKADPKAKTWISSKAKTTAAAKTAPARKKRAKIPHVTHPMLATLIDAPFDDDAWLFEIKWDGFRALCTISENGAVSLLSRNGKEFLPQFPTLAKLGESFKDAPIVVDGEIVALDADGKSSFQALQNRMARHAPRVAFVVFDVLYAEGRDLRDEPLEARKAVLERLMKKGSTLAVYSAHVVGEGRKLFAAAEKKGLEGIIAKRRDGKYLEKRTRDWVKIKVQLTQECVIAGWTEPGGSRSDFGSLVLGVYEGGKLVYAGNVGTGFSRETLGGLMKQLAPLQIDACPFATRPKTRTRAHWVKPKLVAQIRFTEWTHEGLMRHPAFLGLRDDKKAAECTRERPRPAREVTR